MALGTELPVSEFRKRLRYLWAILAVSVIVLAVAFYWGTAPKVEEFTIKTNTNLRKSLEMQTPTNDRSTRFLGETIKRNTSSGPTNLAIGNNNIDHYQTLSSRTAFAEFRSNAENFFEVVDNCPNCFEDVPDLNALSAEEIAFEEQWSRDLTEARDRASLLAEAFVSKVGDDLIVDKANKPLPLYMEEISLDVEASLTKLIPRGVSNDE